MKEEHRLVWLLSQMFDLILMGLIILRFSSVPLHPNEPARVEASRKCLSRHQPYPFFCYNYIGPPLQAGTTQLKRPSSHDHKQVPLDVPTLSSAATKQTRA